MAKDRVAPLAKHRVIEADLLGEVTSGRLAVGERIATSGEVCKRYGVSMPTADKAITSLVAKGYLTRTQRRGTFVRDWRGTVQNVGQADSISLVCTQDDLHRYGQFLYSANKEAERDGYHLTFSPMGSADDSSIPLVIRKNRTLGTLILGTLSDQQAKGILAEKLPHLFVGNHRNTFGHPCVRFDMADAGYQITKKLLEVDRGPVWLLIQPTIDVFYSQELLDGYQRAVLEHPDTPCDVHIRRRDGIDSDVATLMEQMMARGWQDVCMLGDYYYIQRLQTQLDVTGTDINLHAVGVAAKPECELPGIDRMILCDASVTLPAEEGVRQLIAHAKTGEPVTGKTYKLHIESVNDQRKPLRLSWK